MPGDEDPDGTATLEEEIIVIAREIADSQPTRADDSRMWHWCGVCGKSLAMDDDPTSHYDGCLWVRLRAAVQRLDGDDATTPVVDVDYLGQRPGNSDIHVKAGDTWPPLRLSSDHSDIAIDLRDATTVKRSIDGGPWEDADVIDQSRGIVAFPSLDKGIHVVEYEVDWGDGRIETIPSHQQRIIAHEDLPDA